METPWLRDLEEAARRAHNRFQTPPRIVVLGTCRSGKSALLSALFPPPLEKHELPPERGYHGTYEVCGLEICEAPGFGGPTCSVDDAIVLTRPSHAHLLLHVLNGAAGIARDDLRLRSWLARYCHGHCLTILAKGDLLDEDQARRYTEEVHTTLRATECWRVSAHQGAGIAELARRIAEVLPLAMLDHGQALEAKEESRQDRRVRCLIYGAACTCAAAASIPFPFAAILAITPLQLGMIAGIGRAMGVRVTQAEAVDLMRNVGGVVGAGVVFRAAARELRKLVPGATVVDAGMAFAGTCTLGHAAAHLFRHGRLPSAAETRTVYQNALAAAPSSGGPDGTSPSSSEAHPSSTAPDLDQSSSTVE